LVIGAALIMLAGCSGGEDKADGGEPKQSASPLATYSGNAETAKKYVDVLRRLDADLVDDEPRAISNGVNTCQELSDGKSPAQAAQNAADRFEVDVATAQQIVTVTKTNLCN
jgi:hypothetical protein